MLGLNGKSPNGVGIAYYYGNTCCRVFKGDKKLGRFLPKKQHTQRKLLNFDNWEVSKSQDIRRSSETS